MSFSDQLESKFQNLLAHTSAKRAVVLPIALFIQDELGGITAEVVEEIAARLGLTESQVGEELARYSMLKMERPRKQPIAFPSRTPDTEAEPLRRAA